MKVVSTNIGKPQSFTFNGVTLKSSFFRKPQVAGIDITFEKVIGDEFFGKSIHGIKEAVVYAYSRKAQEQFSSIFENTIEIGQFGENLTIDDLNEKDFFVGSIYSVGSVEIKVTGPRYPCNRFNICFKNETAQKKFEAFNRPGVYFEVLKEGKVKVDDTLTLVKKGQSPMTVSQMYHFLFLLKNQPDKLDSNMLNQIINDIELPDVYKRRFKSMST